MRSSAANWSRAAAASPGVAREVGQVVAVDQGVGVLGAEDALGYGQQRGELVPGGGRVPRLPGPVGQAGAGGQGVGVLGAEDALGYGQQRGELVPGGGRVPRLPGRVGEFAPRGQGAGVLGTGCVGARIAVGGDRVVGCGAAFRRAAAAWISSTRARSSASASGFSSSRSAHRPAHRPARAARINSISAPAPPSELLACLLQPLLDQLGLLGVPAAQQLGVPALRRLPPARWPRHLPPSGRPGPPVRAGSPPASPDPLLTSIRG